MRTRWRQIGLILSLLAAAGGAGCWSLYRATQSVPDFYEVALKTKPIDAEAAGDQLERQVFTFHSDLNHEQSWEAIFSDQQINGWLATDMEQKFPALIPREVSEPRVLFEEESARVAFQLKSPKLSAIVSFRLTPRLTENPNELAIVLSEVRAGAVPLPLGNILEQIAAKARQNGLSLEWSESEGRPVALLKPPLDRAEIRPGVRIQQLFVRQGELYLAGIAAADPLVRQSPDSHTPQVNSVAQANRHSQPQRSPSSTSQPR